MSSPNLYDTEYQIGQDNIRRYGLDVHNPVFLISAVLVLVFVVGTLLVPEDAASRFDSAKVWSINNFDWLFLLAGNIFVIFCLALIVLPVGSVRLGGQDAKPDFSLTWWFAMPECSPISVTGPMISPFWSIAC